MVNPGSYFTKPQGAVARWCDAVAVSVAGFCGFLSYYLIEFKICRDYRCEDFVVTSFYASISWLYLVYGLALLGVGVFLVVARDLPRAFALAITVSSLSGFFLSGMIVFAMLREAGQVS